METIGGQAIIEGVMLRKRNVYTLAVRNSKKKIIVSRHKIPDYRTGLLSFFNLPIFRGMYALFEMLVIGIKSLIYSSSISANEDEKLGRGEIAWVLIGSITITILFFVIIPYALTTLLGFNEAESPIVFNAADAAIKLVFFFAYVFAISRMKDIQRVFQYHGAEHMTVHCHEHKLALTPANVRKFSPVHPRCGSSFIMLVILISIVLFGFLPMLVLSHPAIGMAHFLVQRTVLGLARILAIPVIAGLAYEVLKLAGKYSENSLMKAISLPGHLLQLITTKQPDSGQILVAIAAMKKLLRN